MRSPIGTTKNLSKIATNGSLLVAVGDGVVITSKNGDEWQVESVPSDFKANSVVWIGSCFIAVGEEGSIFSSPDGKTWTAQISGVKHPIYDVVWTGNTAVAVGGYASPLVLTSPDGMSWNKEALPEGLMDFRSAVWTGSQLIAVGNNGTIATSLDGRLWRKVHGETYDPMLYGIAWSGKGFVAVGVTIYGKYSGLTSADGEVWSDSRIPAVRNIYAVAWCRDHFTAIGESGGAWTSVDGRHWETTYSGQDLKSIFWTGTRVIAVGNNGIVLRREGN